MVLASAIAIVVAGLLPGVVAGARWGGLAGARVVGGAEVLRIGGCCEGEAARDGARDHTRTRHGDAGPDERGDPGLAASRRPFVFERLTIGREGQRDGLAALGRVRQQMTDHNGCSPRV